MRRALLLALVLPAALAACAPSHSAPQAKASAAASQPCRQALVYPVGVQSEADGWLASWASPPVPGDSTPGRTNTQHVTASGNPSLEDLGSKGSLLASHRFSVHYSLQGAVYASGSCVVGGAFWSLDCPDGSSRYADLWAHSDPCVWDEGLA